MKKKSPIWHRNLWFVISGICLVLILLSGRVVPEGNARSAENDHGSFNLLVPHDSGAENQVFLPLVQEENQTRINDDLPIWPHNLVSGQNEVSLFRYSFHLEGGLGDAELQIFADTRYEAWFDGVFIGRGPARFSRTTHEYDILPIGSLSPGDHLIAVLVQWAPNNRRSESQTPLLKAHVQGMTSRGVKVVASTGSGWKAIVSDAWNRDSVPVHSWGLIGPTELLDLRRLPSDWMDPTYDDGDWDVAVTIDPTKVNYQPLMVPLLDIFNNTKVPELSLEKFKVSTVTGGVANYQPRTIPMLEDVEITPNVLDAGLLSPGFEIGEIDPIFSPEYSFTFTATAETSFTIKSLALPDEQTIQSISLDGQDLDWQNENPKLPDVYNTTLDLSAGGHILSFQEVPAEGETFSMSAQNIQWSDFPFEQGVNAGRRMLLSKPVSQSDQITVVNEDSLNLLFNNSPSYVVLDLGRTIQGRMTAQVSGASGTIIDIGWDERVLDGTLRPLPFPGSLHPQWDQTDSWVLDGTERTISTLDTRSGRFVLIEVWGTGAVSLSHIHIYEERYPVTQVGEFEASDLTLQEYWQLGVDTAYPNMTDAYADPWRERGQWWGDAYVVDHVNRAAFGDTSLLKRGLSFMAEAFYQGKPTALAPNGVGNYMLDYGMLWVQSLSEYQSLTNDLPFIGLNYHVLREFMDFLTGYENPTSGLLDIPLGPWSQTVYIETRGADSRYGQSTAVNALYYSTLMKAAVLAELVGDQDNAQIWREKGIFIKGQINSLLYLPGEKRYLSSIFQGNPIFPSPHSQAWPLAYGVVPEDKVNDVASSLLDLISSDPSLPNIDIFGMYWVLDGLGKAGRISEALDLIKLYYGRLLNLGATTTWEVFNANQFFTQSLSHGWGSSPTWFLTRYLVGAERTGPDSWSVSPEFKGVDSVSGTLPLEHGSLQVQWAKNTCGVFNLQVTAPVESEGMVLIPASINPNQITLNGAVIWRIGDPSSRDIQVLKDGIHISIEGGIYNFSILGNQDC